MATLLAPYNTAMQLGQGFNSFTQQLCVDRAVLRDAENQVAVKEKADTSIAQTVSYRLTIIDKVTDVTNAMNINAAFAIKYDAFNASGKGDFVDTSKVKESDISFMIQVKVINQVIYDNTLTKFNPITEAKGHNFVDVYGDSFISGFQEGGEFTAVISVKARDRAQANSIKANAAINFTSAKIDAKLDGAFGKEANDLMTENETTISVMWTGGGQGLKDDAADWTFETMRIAALKFPTLVAHTPMRTHAILTKFTALRSFYAATLGSAHIVPDFEQAGVYTTFLQEAYLDYKAIAKNLQVLAYDASSGAQKLVPSRAETAAKSTSSSPAATTTPAATQSSTEESKPSKDSDSDTDAVVVAPNTASSNPSAATAPAPKRIVQPFPATVAGIEQARQAVRQMLNRIVAEVDAVARNPGLATDETREQPYLSPAQFRDFLPTGEPVAPVATAGTAGGPAAGAPETKDDMASRLAGLADGQGGVARF